MRLALSVMVLWIAMGSDAAFCEDGPLGDPPPPALSDPSLASSVRFSPKLTTAGVAETGSSLSATSRSGARNSCARTNPCAVATTAIDRAIPARAN